MAFIITPKFTEQRESELFNTFTTLFVKKKKMLAVVQPLARGECWESESNEGFTSLSQIIGSAIGYPPWNLPPGRGRGRGKDLRCD